MKHFGILLFCLGSSLAYGQDILLLKNGEKVEAQVLEVRKHDIQFKRFDDLAGPAYIISRRQVSDLTYETIITETFFSRSAKFPEIAQVTDTPVRQISLPESAVQPSATWAFYLRDCIATFRKITPRGLLVKHPSNRW